MHTRWPRVYKTQINRSIFRPAITSRGKELFTVMTIDLRIPKYSLNFNVVPVDMHLAIETYMQSILETTKGSDIYRFCAMSTAASYSKSLSLLAIRHQWELSMLTMSDHHAVARREAFSRSSIPLNFRFNCFSTIYS